MASAFVALKFVVSERVLGIGAKCHKIGLMRTGRESNHRSYMLPSRIREEGMMFTGIAASGETIAYRDGKRHLWFLSFIPPLVPILSYWLYLVSGNALTTLIPFLYIFGLIPLLDALIGEDRHNPPAEVVAAMEADPYYLWLTRAAVPLLWLSLIVTVAFVGTQELPWWS